MPCSGPNPAIKLNKKGDTDHEGRGLFTEGMGPKLLVILKALFSLTALGSLKKMHLSAFPLGEQAVATKWSCCTSVRRPHRHFLRESFRSLTLYRYKLQS